jgi:hypothetical protein
MLLQQQPSYARQTVNSHLDVRRDPRIPTLPLTDTDKKSIVARSATERPTELAREHGITREYVYTLIRKSSQEITEIELQMLRAHFTRELPSLVVYYGPGYQTGLDYFQYILDRLKARQVNVRVIKRAIPQGVIFALQDERLNYNKETH